jgi:hypothetical protein
MHYQRRKRCLDTTRSIHGRKTRPTEFASHGSYWHVRVSIYRRDHRDRRWHHGSCRAKDCHCLRVYLHLLLRQLLGSCRVGRHRRVVPTQGSCQVSLDDHGIELAAQLGDRVLDAIYGRPGSRQPAVEGVLRLGIVLLRLHRFCVSPTSHPYILPSSAVDGL